MTPNMPDIGSCYEAEIFTTMYGAKCGHVIRYLFNRIDPCPTCCHTHEDPTWLTTNDYDILVVEKGCTSTCGSEYLIEIRERDHPHCGERLWVWLEPGLDMDIDRCYRVVIDTVTSPSCGYTINRMGNEIPCPIPLGKVKIALLYERIGDGKWIDRSVEDEIEIFKETNTDFIFRAFWRWFPIPEKCEDLADEEKRELCELKGYSYSHFKEAILKIKSEIPDVIICGAVGAQFLREIDRNPITGEIFDKKETQSMRLNPSKWGINKSLLQNFVNTQILQILSFKNFS